MSFFRSWPKLLMWLMKILTKFWVTNRCDHPWFPHCKPDGLPQVEFHHVNSKINEMIEKFTHTICVLEITNNHVMLAIFTSPFPFLNWKTHTYLYKKNPLWKKNKWITYWKEGQLFYNWKFIILLLLQSGHG